MNPIDKLTELFRQFPGIGPRQAKRFVYFLLTRNNGYTGDLAESIRGLKSTVTYCPQCFRFFMKDKAESGLCSICRNPSRDTETLMIISHDIDFENIEKTHLFNGLYFILGGTVPILEKKPDERIRERQLLDGLDMRVKNGLKEIILALSYNPEGENTITYLQNILRERMAAHGIKISTLGRGLSTGTELEYSDGETIKNALQNRH